ncbi:MAG: hypothetical protein ABSB11_04670 [Sedimentisphaerales bacterium]|jgi:hypothetical protein
MEIGGIESGKAVENYQNYNSIKIGDSRMNIELLHKPVSSTNPAKVALTVKGDEAILMTDQVDLSREAKRTEFVAAVVKKYPGIDADDLSDKLLRIANELLTQENTDSEETQIASPLELSKKALAETDSELVDASMKFLKSENLVDYIIAHIEQMGLVGEKPLSLALYLIFTSRLLPRPLAGSVLGISSGGKSFSISTVAMLFPPETILQAHRLTPAALQYMPKGSLIHRAVIAGERSHNVEDEAAEATRALREMISDGVLRIAVCGKDGSGNIVTHHVEQPGPIAYVESTTLGTGEIFDEDRTRFLFLCCDESELQSKAIIARLAADAAKPKLNEELESIIALHHTAQRLLKAKDVVIPFAQELTDAIPCRRPESRRAFGHLLNLIRATALLHQYQRKTDGAGRIIATVDDYDVIRKYLSEPIGRGMGVVLTSGADSLLEAIKEHYDINERFTAADLKEKTGMGRVVYDRIKELRHHGYLKLAEAGAGNVAAKYELNPMPDGAIGLVLPELKKISSSLLGANTHTNSQGLIC